MLRLLLFTVLLILSSGCMVNPVTGKNELSLVSTQQEIAIGSQQYGPSQQSQGGLYYVDPKLQSYISEVGLKLAAVSDSPELPYQFVVLNNPAANAWALPGGKIAINRGLLIMLENESQLAAVLSHEIVHAAARHGASQMSRGQLLGIGVGLFGAATQNTQYGQLADQASQLGAAAWMARYGRDAELESDAYGMEYMSKVGYDPMGAVELQQLFVKLSEGQSNQEQAFFSALFASHPPSQERVNKNLQRAKTLPAGDTFRDRYQRAINQLKKDQPAYQAQNEALQALKNNDGSTALVHLDKAIKWQPDEGQFWENRGHAWKMLKENSNAELAYGTAIRKNPDYFAPYLYRGITRFENKDVKGSLNDLNKSHTILPSAISAFYLAEVNNQLGATEVAEKYYQQAAKSGGELSKKAQQRLIAMHPEQAILVKLILDEYGYVVLVAKNSSSTNITNIQVQIANSSGKNTIVDVGVLNSGQQKNINSIIGPFTDPTRAPRLVAKVVKASLAQE